MNEFLLRKILQRAATAVVRHGILATASSEQKEGKLLSLACNIWEISINELARKAVVSEISLSRFVSEDLPLVEGDRAAILIALDRMTGGERGV